MTDTKNVKFSTVDEYINSFPEHVQEILQQIREIIKSNAVEAEEVISYNIPAFKFHGMLIFYSAYTNHISLSIPPSKVYEAFKNELSSFKVSKSAIQFPLGKPIPITLIKEMTKFRVKENQEAAAKKTRTI